ncbi:hypothetical protein Cgig2_032989 [Carnegiea gigantea]|uniref:Reverse transcriptase zinc-binding domain-containing protein n=1 Tax=Carnegiea gigantea TaxID=171969 RepID=A0A9Q1JQI3_9CARY|nr:hypothetical protein Cgig2_032989 [Carnegiea gigantea]
MEEREFSVFVYNIPAELDRHGLRGIFQKAGRVSDTYIPLEEQEGIMQGLDSYDSEGKTRPTEASLCSIMQTLEDAQYQFQGHDMKKEAYNIHTTSTPQERGYIHSIRIEKQKAKSGDRNAYTRVTEMNEECQLHKIALEGTLNEEFTEWLARSLVCTTEEPRDLATLASVIDSGFGLCSKICALSSLKFILTFPTMAQMEESLNNHEELDIWFNNIKRWSIDDSCETRRVWVEVFGVPPCGWCWENFDKIASLWGRLITLGKAISRTDSFEPMKMLIVTDVFNRIDQDVILNLRDGGYRERTKTVSFSQNGYFEEVLKLSQQPMLLGKQQTPERLEAHKPPGFGTPDLNQVNDLCQTTDYKANGNPKAVIIVEDLPEEGEFRDQSNETVEPPQLSTSEIQHATELCNLLQQYPPARDKKDYALWCKKKEFSTNKLLHKVDKAMRQTAEVDCLVSSVWINLAPPKVEFFVWLALLGKLNTKHMLLRKGVISDRDLNCSFCGIHDEDLDHVLGPLRSYGFILPPKAELLALCHALRLARDLGAQQLEVTHNSKLVDSVIILWININ